MARFKLVVYPDPIAELSLESATRDDFEEWRERFMEGRQPRSLNRQVRAVVAGLNRARQLGHVGNPEAWKPTPLSDDVDDEGDTAVFLSAEQRRAIIAAASPPMAEFLRGLELTGARPKELAATTAADFDGQALRLAHREGKAAEASRAARCPGQRWRQVHSLGDAREAGAGKRCLELIVPRARLIC